MGGIITHRRSGAPRGRVALSEDKTRAAAMVKAGSPKAAVAAAYGVTVWTVTRWIAEVAEAEREARR